MFLCCFDLRVTTSTATLRLLVQSNILTLQAMIADQNESLVVPWGIIYRIQGKHSPAAFAESTSCASSNTKFWFSKA